MRVSLDVFQMSQGRPAKTPALAALAKCSGTAYSPDEGRLWLATRVSKVQNQGEIAIVDGNTGDIDDAGDALLQFVRMPL